ncbi:EndoU domain-containing protein [Spirosoma pulveris]
MEDELFYYIVDNLITQPHSLPAGMRILAIPMRGIRLPDRGILQFEEGEGPYESIKQLKENSEMYRALLISDPKRAIKIFEPRFMAPATNAGFYAFKGNNEYEKQLSKLFYHASIGTISKQGVSGIHYLNPNVVRITRLLGFDKNGIQIAMIEVRKTVSEPWVAKKQFTTLFPPHWSLTYMIAACEFAFENRVYVSDTMAKGFTKKGIAIAFVFDSSGLLRTAYPICDELYD